MDNVLKHPLFQAGVISVCCYFLAFITRRIVETASPKIKCAGEPYPNKASEWWNTVILYVIPVLYGNIVCLLLRKTTFFPEGYQSWQAAMVLGTALGFMSGFFYKVLKRLVMREAGVEKEDNLPTANVPDPPGGKP